MFNYEKTQRDLRRQIDSARSESGLSWKDVSDRLKSFGLDISAGHLSTKHSRMTWRATEVIMVLRVLGGDAPGTIKPKQPIMPNNQAVQNKHKSVERSYLF